MSLQGKSAIITGSTSGIGKGVAEALAAEGCNVMLNGFGDETEIETQRAALEKNHQVKALYNGADMTKPDEIEALVKQAANDFGSVDIIVNNAGIQYVCPVDEYPTEKWDQIIAINLSSAFHMIRCSVPHMKKAGWGRIINLASAHALVASPFKTAYVAAKHGMAGLTKSVALEVAQDKITCNAICPGYVKTPLVENQIADTAKARGIPEEDVVKTVMLANQPTKEFVRIEEIGAMSVYLCSDGAAGVTGTMLSIDGGWCAQ